MSNFQLFRIEIQPRSQRNMFAEDAESSRRNVLRDVVMATPSSEFRAGTQWHIGNVQEVGNHGIFFCIGKSSESDIEVYEQGKFFTEDIERAPFTETILDVRLQCIGIAKDYNVAQSAEVIADRLQRLMNKSPVAEKKEAVFDIKQVKDPKEFLEYLRDAYAITKYKITLPRPNAWDVDEDFVKPVQGVISKVNGQSADAEIKGQNLDSEKLEEVTRSAASTGDNVEASIREERDGKLKRKKMSGNPVNFEYDGVDSDDDREGLLQLLRRVYHEVRG